MGLFGFGKKKEANQKKSKDLKKYSKRLYDRYHVDNLYVQGYGKIINFSKNGAAIRKENISEVKKDWIDIKLENIEISAKLKRETLKEFGVKFDNEIDKSLIEKHLKRLKEYDFKAKDLLNIDFYENEKLEKIKHIISLMLELDDPNTTIEKFKVHIEALPVLKSKILTKANTVENAKSYEVKDITAAITRLGFEEVKKIVYSFINEKISFSNASFSNFDHYEFYNFFKSSIFKKLAPLFSFRDLRGEGRSLLSTETLGIELLCSLKKFKNIYKSPKEIYSYTARVYEEKIFAKNFLEINKEYLVDRLSLFKYLYDGYILAHLYCYPYIKFKNEFSISLSPRKLRFSYVAYLTILALKFVLSNDKRSGLILLSRLKRLGLDSAKALSFLNETIFETKKILDNLDIKGNVRSVSYPSISINLEKIFGKELHISSFIEKMDIASKEDKVRIAFRYEDSYIAMKFIEASINSLEFNFYDLPFCIIPSQNLKDDELKLETFNGFELIIFKDIEKLPKNLMDDFLKIWRDFEGKIFVTYSAYSMIDFNYVELHYLLREYIIDIPSPFEHESIYETMLDIACKEINSDLNSNICNKDNFLNEIYAIDSIFKIIVEKFVK